MSNASREIDQISISSRYCGPPDTANGGYLAGLLSGYFDRGDALSISFRAATPLEKVLKVIETENESGKTVQIVDDENVLAMAKVRDIEVGRPALPPVEQINSVEMQCAGFIGHPFPACFVCGPDRPRGDGLGIYPGPVELKGLSEGLNSGVAAEWTLLDDLKDNDGKVKNEFIWAALDCISAFANLEKKENQYLVPMVLGNISARLEQSLAGDKAYVIAWPLKVEGRKAFANSIIYNQQQECIAVGQAVWVSLNKI